MTCLAYPLLLQSGRVYTLSTMPVLPLMKAGLMGFSTTIRKAQEAIDLAEDNPDAYIQYADTYIKFGKPEEAREYIDNNGCDHYSLEKEIKSLDTPFKCNMVQWWLENRKWELMKEHIADMKTKMGKK